MTKKAMIELHKEGITPHIQVHDELDISVADEAEAAKIKRYNGACCDLEVPNKVDYESGPNWGSIKCYFMVYFKCKHSCRICTDKEEYLYDLKKHHGEVEDCIIFGVTLYWP